MGGARRGRGPGIVVVGDIIEIAIAFRSLAAVDRVSAVGDPELTADALRVRRVCGRERRRHAERASERARKQLSERLDRLDCFFEMWASHNNRFSLLFFFLLSPSRLRLLVL